MPDERVVQCQDCGYEWESTAETPRCSQPGCRTRNVEEKGSEADTSEDEQEDADPNGSDGDDSGDEASPDAEPVEPEPDDGDDESSGFTAAFEANEVETDWDGENDEAPGLRDLDAESSGGSSSTSSTSSESEDEQDDEDDGDEFDAEDIPDIDPEQLKPVFRSAFSLLDRRMRADWGLSESERDELSEAWAPVLNHYAPVLVKQHAVAGAALVTTAAVLMPRLQEERDLREQEEARKREAEHGSGTLREQRSGSVESEDEQFREASPSDVADTAFDSM